MHDYDPPHVHDDTPLDSAPWELAGILSRRFLQAAQHFRSPSGKLERLSLGNGSFAEYPAKLKDRCGEWIIQAQAASLIPPDQTELLDLITWHTAENPPLSPSRKSMRIPCPYNLFVDLVGGNDVSGTYRGRDARGRVNLDNARVGGGMMPRKATGHLDLPHNERCAATCEWIADLIERAGKQEKNTAPDPFSDLCRFAHDNLIRLQRAVIEALCKAGGELPLEAIKDLCEWQPPIRDAWDSLRKRLNKKIKDRGYELVTHDGEARLKPLT